MWKEGLAEHVLVLTLRAGKAVCIGDDVEIQLAGTVGEGAQKMACLRIIERASTCVSCYRTHESFRVGERIGVSVAQIDSPMHVRLAIAAPREVAIVRRDASRVR